MSTRRLLGLDFTDLCLDQIAQFLAGRGATAPFAYVVTPNADHLVRVVADSALQHIYRRALVCLLDSRAVAMLLRLFSLPTPAAVPGSDLTARLLERHLQPGERITIVGLSPVWLPGLVKRYDLVPPAHYDPPMGFERDPAAFAATLDFVRAHPARFIFLAVGAPRQEMLADALATLPGLTGTALCIGSGLEYLCGARRRAPAVLRYCGMEWVWRLLQEPRRLARRYLIDSPKIIVLLARERARSL